MVARPNPHQWLIKGGGGRDQTRRIPKTAKFLLDVLCTELRYI